MFMKPGMVVIGAGPAGLAAAHEAAGRGLRPLVLEKTGRLGGIARTEFHDGFYFDVGGHRFFTRLAEIETLWRSLLGDDLMTVPRRSSILFRGRKYRYPLNPVEMGMRFNPMESVRILASYAGAKLRPNPTEHTFEDWTVNRFGRRLFEKFFGPYTEKVWGVPCRTLPSEWAEQRIAGLSMGNALFPGLTGRRPKTLIDAFLYPALGPGMMWDRMAQETVRLGGEIRLGAEALRIVHDGRRIRRVRAGREGPGTSVPAEEVVSSMPLADLVMRLDPPAPDAVLRAAGELRHRDLIVVTLALNRPARVKDQWLYVHDASRRVGRVQVYSNWSARMVPDPERSSLGMEYFCTRGDSLWRLPDAELVRLAGREASALGLADPSALDRGRVIRESLAYPMYTRGYRDHVDRIREHISRFANLATVGRNGMHRYNNQDHSMHTGILAVRNTQGERHDLWSAEAS